MEPPNISPEPSSASSFAGSVSGQRPSLVPPPSPQPAGITPQPSFAGSSTRIYVPPPPQRPQVAPPPPPKQPAAVVVPSKPEERVPSNVIPGAFSLRALAPVQVAPECDEPGDQVGLFRRMSVYPSYLEAFCTELEFSNQPGCFDWREHVLGKLLGHKTADEFYGAGRRSLPGHDQLGLFPCYVDQHGRQYFDMVVTGLSTTAANMVMGLRLPRHLRRVRPDESSQRRLEFPVPNETLILRPCGLPIWAFYWSMIKRDVNSIADAQAANLALVESQYDIYHAQSQVRVRNTTEERDATCAIELEPLAHEQFWKLYYVLRALRDEWSANCIATFRAMLRWQVPIARVLAFCHYLQQFWVHNVAQWTRKKTNY